MRLRATSMRLVLRCNPVPLLVEQPRMVDATIAGERRHSLALAHGARRVNPLTAAVRIARVLTHDQRAAEDVATRPRAQPATDRARHRLVDELQAALRVAALRLDLRQQCQRKRLNIAVAGPLADRTSLVRQRARSVEIAMEDDREHCLRPPDQAERGTLRLVCDKLLRRRQPPRAQCQLAAADVRVDEPNRRRCRALAIAKLDVPRVRILQRLQGEFVVADGMGRIRERVQVGGTRLALLGELGKRVTRLVPTPVI